MNVEWSIPVVLTSPKGTIHFNTDDAGSHHRFLLDPTKCLIGPQTLRTTTDDNPQADGGIVHRAFRSLVVAKLGIQFWYGATGADATVACDANLRAMYDKLMLHLAALASPSQAELDAGSCRLTWTPSGAPDRMIDRIQMLGWSNPANDGVLVSDEFTFQTPFPYGMNLAQTTTALPATVVNTGTSAFWPVFKVHGPTTQFSIFNVTTGLQISYDSSLPGGQAIAGGHYAEINTFRNTIYLDGNSSNLKAGVCIGGCGAFPGTADFFPLVVGSNEIDFIADPGATADMLWNIAWA